MNLHQRLTRLEQRAEATRPCSCTRPPADAAAQPGGPAPWRVIECPGRCPACGGAIVRRLSLVALDEGGQP